MKRPSYGGIPAFDPSQNDFGLSLDGSGSLLGSLEGLHDASLRNKFDRGTIHDGLHRRAVESSLADCETLCDRYPNCVGLNYYNTNCTLFSRITGQVSFPNGVAVAVLSKASQSVSTQTSVPQTSTSQASSVGQSTSAVSSSEASQTTEATTDNFSSSALLESSAGPTTSFEASTTVSRCPHMFHLTAGEILTNTHPEDAMLCAGVSIE